MAAHHSKAVHLVLLASPGSLPGLPRQLARRLGEASVLATGIPPPQQLFRLCGLPWHADRPATAALTWLGDGGDSADRGLLQADPVRFVADRDRLLLLPLDPAGFDSKRYLMAFNDHFAGEGIRLTASPRGRWFLDLGDRAPPTTSSLDAAMGGDVHDSLPQGPDAAWWRSLLNETQMLFHQVALQAPESEGMAATGYGIWLHGGGELPVRREAPAIGKIRAADGLAAGLALHCGIELRHDTSVAARNELVAADLNGRGDWEPVQQLVEQCCRDRQAWSLTLPDGRVFGWRPWHRWRVWRGAVS